jgi:hypothetical protein
MAMFSCPACKGRTYVRVEVYRVGKRPYATEFIACSTCRVMLWQPLKDEGKMEPGPLLGTWGGRIKL